jgi:hypothetical protein
LLVLLLSLLACSRNSLASMKRAQQQGDEWAKIYALHIKEGRELDEKAKAAAAAKAAALKQVGLQDKASMCQPRHASSSEGGSTQVGAGCGKRLTCVKRGDAR